MGTTPLGLNIFTAQPEAGDPMTVFIVKLSEKKGNFIATPLYFKK